MNDVATMSYEKHQNEEISNYVKKKNPEITEKVLSLIASSVFPSVTLQDQQSIEKASKSSLENTVTKEDQLAAAHCLRRALSEARSEGSRTSRESTDLKPESPEMVQSLYRII